MISRRIVFVASILATAASFFTLGVLHTRQRELTVRASYDVQLAELRAEVRSGRGQSAETSIPAATVGKISRRKEDLAAPGPSPMERSKFVDEIKQELQSEMGLLPVHLLRDRRSSFVELYSYDTLGKTSYGTAGYLGHGYFVTVKHAVVALRDEENGSKPRRITSVRIVYRGKEIPARVVDTGDADVEVHSGDWAIIKTRELDLPALHVDASYPYDFADPIFRLGNDYSKGIILSTGYVGQHTPNGLVTCLTDGHPGVSGGGVLNQHGDLVGIPIGRMQGDYRFSFILPMRAEMLRRLPAYEVPAPQVGAVAEPQ